MTIKFPNFEEMDKNLLEIKLFLLDLLKERNPQEYLKFLLKISKNPDKLNEERLYDIKTECKV